MKTFIVAYRAGGPAQIYLVLQSASSWKVALIQTIKDRAVLILNLIGTGYLNWVDNEINNLPDDIEEAKKQAIKNGWEFEIKEINANIEDIL